MRYENGSFIDKKVISPFRTMLFVAGKALDNVPFEEQLPYLVNEGMSVIELEWKDAFGPRVLEVRSATVGELEQFLEGIRRQSDFPTDNPDQQILAKNIVRRISKTIDERTRIA